MTTHTDPPSVSIALQHAVTVFDEGIARVPDERWTAQSPCEGWTARDVVAHVIGTMNKALTLLSGSDYSSEPSRPENQPDPVASWPDIRDRVRDAVHSAPLDREVETAHGRGTVADGLRFPAADVAVHAWDVATATGLHMELPAELRAHIVAVSKQVPEEVLRGPGLFGPALSAPPGADETTALMAWLGRDTQHTA